MGKSIYTHYKERLIEIGGGNKCLYLKKIVRRGAYDIGRILETREDKMAELVDFLFGRSKKYVYTLIEKSEREELLDILNPESVKEGEESPRKRDEALERKKARQRREAASKVVLDEVQKLKELHRESEEIERERGRRELYVGYPFVFGSVADGPSRTTVKAPLILFPVKIDIVDEFTVELTLLKSEKTHINRALVFAYAQSKKLNVDSLELEFDSIEDRFKSVDEVISYLASAGIKIDGQVTKNVLAYSRFKEPDGKNEASLRNAIVLGRFPLSNSIYSDYSMLEKRNLSNNALAELLRIGKVKKEWRWPWEKEPEKSPFTYAIKMLDYAQSEVVRGASESGNMVIYGPPGTGKSQTIVNIIADAITKNKRVLVVSQKKAALDVVYNRLGLVAEKAMYITDESKEKRFFYERCFDAHNRDVVSDKSDLAALETEYLELEEAIKNEEAKLEGIHRTLTVPRMPFGISLAEMYSSSYNFAKNSMEYQVYTSLVGNAELMSLNYKELRSAMLGISEMKLGETYYEFVQSKEKNPLIDQMKVGLDIRTLAEVKDKLEAIQRSKKGLFNLGDFPYFRQALAFYYLLDDEKKLEKIVKFEADLSGVGFFERKKKEEEIKASLVDTLESVKEFTKEYECLNEVLTPDGYLAVIDNILRGNTSYIKLVYEALDNYIALRDVNTILTSLDKNKLNILNFAYTTSKNYQNYLDILDKLEIIRIYHEVLHYEETLSDELAHLVDFDNITSRIYKMKEAELEVAIKISRAKSNKEYEALYEGAKNNKDYLYQISKKQKYWPIRKTMEVYGNFILSLFPCWLLSPENVSSLLPLTKNLFDLVIFDEASQIFIENTIPTIYRGKSIVVAGDDKQLRPSATFMKRYLGHNPELEEDYSVQAALEVDSLLDLAVARYEAKNLTYHYRSRSQELIDFSNAAFYNSGLQVAPNVSKNTEISPILRYKVDGRWLDRRNEVEAAKVVEILKGIFETRKNNESIGIITFNSEQQAAIADMIDAEAKVNGEFRSTMMLEERRNEDGEDKSIFIKNLENVQGDERDIIIFSIGYAKNAEGKVYTSFGSLSQDGGENRLNVAITRAKTQVIVVTSIEPEELKVDNAKNQGPKLLQKYLQYVRAVAERKPDEINAILGEISKSDAHEDSDFTALVAVEEDMKARLEKLGYKVDTRLGSRSNRISLAIFDEKSDRYLVGVELDRDALLSSTSTMERDVYKPRFLEARGWTILRVWCRDWWLSPQKVIKTIREIAERNKKKK